MNTTNLTAREIERNRIQAERLSLGVEYAQHFRDAYHARMQELIAKARKDREAWDKLIQSNQNQTK